MKSTIGVEVLHEGCARSRPTRDASGRMTSDFLSRHPPVFLKRFKQYTRCPLTTMNDREEVNYTLQIGKLSIF